MSDDCKDFIRKCLDLDPTKRLGSKNDVDEILNHPWFNGISKEAILKKEVVAEYIPELGTLDDEGFEMEEVLMSKVMTIKKNYVKSMGA